MGKTRPKFFYVIQFFGYLLLLCFACSAIYFLLPRLQFPISADRKDYSSVAQAFFYALLRNDEKAAKSLTTSAQWARIDNWMVQHMAFSCPFAFTFDEMEGELLDGIGGQTTGSTEANYSYYYRCTQADYYFTLEDIQLRQGNNEWQVIEWGRGCEKRKDQPEKCD